MPKPVADLNAAVQSIVASEVQAVLDPYRSVLDRLARFMGSAPAPRASGGAKAAPAVRRPARRARGARKASAKLAKGFEVGQTVTYKQGRGEFEATVKAIDLDAGTLQLVRVSDGKKVVRPGAKVRTAKASAAPAAARKAPKKRSAPAKATRKPKQARKANPNAGFMKPKQPDDVLAEIVGDKPLTRGEVTKRLWGYIKKNGLQDPEKKRMINADDKLAKVFGGKKQVVMFEMLKLVSKHLA
jgi:hypothetical protein